MKKTYGELNNNKLTNNARNLRHNMTPEELHLWLDFLKMLPIVVKRQKPIGKYIADFYIPCANLVIELDGSQHGKSENAKSDEIRDKFFEGLGIKILRYSNTMIHERFEGVCKDICRHIPGLDMFDY